FRRLPPMIRAAPWTLITIVLLAIVLSGGAPRTEPSRGDSRGGSAAPRWSTTREGGVAWLVTPEGERFFSLGVSSVDGGRRHARPSFHWQNHYLHHRDFVSDTAERLRAWGFNTLGAWSFTPGMLSFRVTPILELGFSESFH